MFLPLDRTSTTVDTPPNIHISMNSPPQDLDKIQESLLLIFGHINHKLKLSPYPICGALPLVEAISRNFNDQLLRVLTSHQLPYTPYETFDRLLA
jgi:hypothetical protein